MNKRQLYEHIMQAVSVQVKKTLNEMTQPKAKTYTDEQKMAALVKAYKEEIKKHKSKNEKSFVINFFNLWSDYIKGQKTALMWDNDDSKFIKYIDSKQIWKTTTIPGYTFQENGTCQIGSYMRWDGPWYTSSILYIAPACKEFDKLNKLLVKYGCKPLANDFLCYQYVTGKRDDIFDTRNINYYCHLPKACNMIIEWLKNNMTPSKTLKMDTTIKISRDEYAYRSESEWDGMQYGKISFEISRNGKILAKESFQNGAYDFG